MSVSEQPLVSFCAELSGASPTPGGGGASAIAGALAAALSSMVAALTVGKKKYAGVEQQMQQQRDLAVEIRDRLLHLADRDAEVFGPLAAAYRMPADTDEHQCLKQQAIQRCLDSASRVPLEIMDCCGGIIRIAAFMADHGSTLAVSDAAASAILAAGALQSASLNVYINTKSMDDRVLAQELNGIADDLIKEYVSVGRQVFETVKGRLRLSGEDH